MENLTVEFTISSYKDANYSIHQNRRLAMFNMKSDGHHQSLVGGRRVEGSEESRTFIYPLALKDMSCSQLQRINGRYTFTLHNPDGTAEQQFQINLQCEYSPSAVIQAPNSPSNLHFITVFFITSIRSFRIHREGIFCQIAYSIAYCHYYDQYCQQILSEKSPISGNQLAHCAQKLE